MYESLGEQIGGRNDRDLIDRQHILMSNLIKTQSDCDFPRGSMRNGLIDGTKCQSSDVRKICSDYCVLHIQQMEVVL